MKYTFFRTALRWRQAPGRLLYFFTQALAAFLVVVIGLTSWNSVWQEVLALRGNAQRALYRMENTTTRNVSPDSVFSLINHDQYQLLQTDFAQELDVTALFGAVLMLSEPNVRINPALEKVMVFVANDFVFEHYLGLPRNEAPESIFITPTVASFEKYNVRRDRENPEAPHALLHEALQGNHNADVRQIDPPVALVEGSSLWKLMLVNMLGVTATDTESVTEADMPTDRYVLIRLEDINWRTMKPTTWHNPLFALLLKEDVMFGDIAYPLMSSLGAADSGLYGMNFITDAEAYLRRNAVLWDSAMEAAILSIVLVLLVGLSLSGCCLTLYKKRQGEYASCLCVGASRRQILAELGLELLPPLLLAGALAYPLGNWILGQSKNAQAYDFVYQSFPWVAGVVLMLGILICAIALILPAKQLKRLDLPAVLKN